MWIRSAAFSCAFACGAMVVGPGVLGTAEAHAILGIGPDIDFFDLFVDDDQKSSLHHPRPGAEDVQRAGGPHGWRNDVGCRPPGVDLWQRSRKCRPGRSQRWPSRECQPWRRRWRGAPQRERRPVIKSAVRTVRPDHPHHRDPRGATRRHTRAGVRAARAAPANWRHSIGQTAAEPAGARRTANASRTAGTRARTSHEIPTGAECFRPRDTGLFPGGVCGVPEVGDDQ